MPLEHIVIKEGDKSIRPKVGKKVRVHYVGKFHGTEKVFDSSRSRGKPFEFVLGAQQVIAGWDQGVALMCKGEICKLVCPPDLAYRARGVPQLFDLSFYSIFILLFLFTKIFEFNNSIPPNSTLDFEVELLDCTAR